MVTNNIINNWSMEHFICYLYLTIGYADSVLLRSEIEMAKQKLSKFFLLFFGISLNSEKIVDDVLNEIQHHTNAEKQAFIKEFVARYRLQDDMKMEIISDLTDIVGVDDVVDLEEHKALSYIRGELYKTA
jgi:uncharacterized protein with gpF-like domain